MKRFSKVMLAVQQVFTNERTEKNTRKRSRAILVPRSVVIFCSMLTAGAADDCTQVGGIRAPVSNTCFFMPPGKGTWEFASRECTNRGATLASIHTEEENEVVKQLWKKQAVAQDLSALGGAWIGINDRAKEDTFLWSDGSKLNFWGFVHGRPLVDKNLGCEPDYRFRADGTIEFVDCDGLQENDSDCVSFGYTRPNGDILEGWVDNNCEMEQHFVCAMDRCSSGIGCYFEGARSVTGSGGGLNWANEYKDYVLDVPDRVDGVISLEILGIRHAWVGDLRFALKDPAGNVYNVLTRHGLDNQYVGSGGSYTGQSYTVVSTNMRGRDWHTSGLVDSRGVLGNSVPPPSGVYKQTWKHADGLDVAFEWWQRVPLHNIRAEPGQWALRVWNRANSYWESIGSAGDIQGWTLNYRPTPDPVTLTLRSSGGTQRVCAGDFTIIDRRLNGKPVYLNSAANCFIAHDGTGWALSHAAMLDGFLATQGPFLFFDGLRSSVLHNMPSFSVSVSYEAPMTSGSNNTPASNVSALEDPPLDASEQPESTPDACPLVEACLEDGGMMAAPGKCFVAELEALPWQDAKAACAQRGGILASVRSPTENDVLFALWDRPSIRDNREAVGGMWLGATDAEAEGIFVWTDGSSADLTPSPWANVYGSQQPNDWNNQDCVSYGFAGAGDWSDREPVPGWVDNSCAVAQPFVCELRCGEPPSPGTPEGHSFRRRAGPLAAPSEASPAASAAARPTLAALFALSVLALFLSLGTHKPPSPARHALLPPLPCVSFKAEGPVAGASNRAWEPCGVV